MADARRLEKLLYRSMKATCEQYELLAPGDRVMVAISGGKDSYTLLHLLHLLKPRLPFPIELVAVHLDQVQPGYDGAPLEAWLADSGYPYEILREDTYTVVTDRLDSSRTYCSLCSRLRRGILYTAAERLGCNKIALGHHRDDALETFLMNTFFSGKLQAMPAQYTTDDGRFQVIRPLIECAEARIAEFAAEQAFPILPCNLCGSQDGLQREQMKELLSAMEAKHPDVRNVMLQSLRNVRPTHLLDRDVQAAWAVRPAGIRPDAEPLATVRHAEAKPRLTVLRD
ncbi:MAG: tRNA 2-thiocytidine(32) synthetase TtcA [Polyangiales bacterium]|nr:tRNA 2-thiocytidine(32) synthetase TtcA [Myxococcales bacterium]MCB9661838.1 tRNA 2-thiocytidine(32) synthetase TtcA [Sandaracinaceae bacterium]